MEREHRCIKIYLIDVKERGLSLERESFLERIVFFLLEGICWRNHKFDARAGGMQVCGRTPLRVDL